MFGLLFSLSWVVLGLALLRRGSHLRARSGALGLRSEKPFLPALQIGVLTVPAGLPEGMSNIRSPWISTPLSVA